MEGNPIYQPLMITNFGNQLGNEVAPLAVVCPLVLEPLSIALDAANLFTIVIWDGVRDRIGRRIDSVSLDSVKELFLFLDIELALSES
jgi:hypothetical protein